jgi:hypothetical protein
MQHSTGGTVNTFLIIVLMNHNILRAVLLVFLIDSALCSFFIKGWSWTSHTYILDPYFVGPHLFLLLLFGPLNLYLLCEKDLGCSNTKPNIKREPKHANYAVDNHPIVEWLRAEHNSEREVLEKRMEEMSAITLHQQRVIEELENRLLVVQAHLSDTTSKLVKLVALPGTIR